MCRERFAIEGIPLKIAKNTPLEFTYTWKHVQRLTKKFIEWQFTLDDIDAYIKIVAKKLNTLPPRQRSLQNVVKNDMMEYCYAELRQQQASNINIMEQFYQAHDWFISTLGTDINEQVLHLTKRYKPGALPNIVLYFQQGRLSKQYIAFSRACRVALNIIGNRSATERNFCPSDTALHYITHYKFKSHTTTIRQILGE